MFNKFMLYSGIALGCHAAKSDELDVVTTSVQLHELTEDIVEDHQSFMFSIGSRDIQLTYRDDDSELLEAVDEEYREKRMILTISSKEADDIVYELRQLRNTVSAHILHNDHVLYHFHPCGDNRILCSKLIGSNLFYLGVVSLLPEGDSNYTVEQVGMIVDIIRSNELPSLPLHQQYNTVLAMYLAVTDMIGMMNLDKTITCTNITLLADRYNSLIVCRANGSETVACVRGTVDGMIDIMGESYGSIEHLQYTVALPAAGDGLVYDIVKRSASSGKVVSAGCVRMKRNRLRINACGRSLDVQFEITPDSVIFSV